MMDVREKYLSDAQFKMLTDTIESYIRAGDFTGSEVRQAAMLACINYEMTTMQHRFVYPDSLETAIQEIERYTQGSEFEETCRRR